MRTAPPSPRHKPRPAGFSVGRFNRTRFPLYPVLAHPFAHFAARPPTHISHERRITTFGIILVQPHLNTHRKIFEMLHHHLSDGLIVSTQRQVPHYIPDP